MVEAEHTGEVADDSGSSLEGSMSANCGNAKAVLVTQPGYVGGLQMKRERL
jgi:hypothetical protein